MVLTCHTFKESKKDDYNKRKNKRESETYGLSNLLLIVNNWGFVRDTQHSDKVRQCTPADFQVQLKLASTAFKNPANPDAEFAFDKQSANFPYESFLQLMKNAGLKKFLHEIKELYEKTEGSLDLESDDDTTAEPKKSGENGEQLFDESTDDEEPVVTIRGIGKKRAQVLEDEEDEVSPVSVNSRKRGKRCLTAQSNPQHLI